MTDMAIRAIFLCMRTTLILDEELLGKASELTGITRKTDLVRKGLESLIARESAKRLAALGGSEKGLRPIPRRRLEAGGR